MSEKNQEYLLRFHRIKTNRYTFFIITLVMDFLLFPRQAGMFILINQNITWAEISFCHFDRSHDCFLSGRNGETLKFSGLYTNKQV